VGVASLVRPRPGRGRTNDATPTATAATPTAESAAAEPTVDRRLRDAAAVTGTAARTTPAPDTANAARLACIAWHNSGGVQPKGKKKWGGKEGRRAVYTFATVMPIHTPIKSP